MAADVALIRHGIIGGVNHHNPLTTYFILMIVAWVVLAMVASLIAPDRRGTFFWTTLLFLGPLGLMAALIAQPQPRAVATVGGWTATDGFICGKRSTVEEVVEG